MKAECPVMNSCSTWPDSPTSLVLWRWLKPKNIFLPTFEQRCERGRWVTISHYWRFFKMLKSDRKIARTVCPDWKKTLPPSFRILSFLILFSLLSFLKVITHFVVCLLQLNMSWNVIALYQFQNSGGCSCSRGVNCKNPVHSSWSTVLPLIYPCSMTFPLLPIEPFL